MAEIWPRLRKKLQKLKSKSGSSRKKPNPYASIGLEKFASLLEEIRSKQQSATSLVERTTSTLSAARSISRSAQEWTASTIVRTIHDTTGVKPSPGAPMQQREEIMGEEKHQSCEKVEEPVKNFASSPLELLKKTASIPLGLGLRLPTTRCRIMTSKSALLVALGTSLSSRAGKVGRALVAALSFSAVIRKWKFSARFLLSSVALYLLFPLRGYLFTRMPEQIILAPSRSNLDDEAVLVREPPVELPVGALISPPLLVSENRSASEMCLPRVRVSFPRRVAKKISSRFKNLNLLKKPRMFRSSISILSSKSPTHHRLKCPLSRKASEITAEAQTSESTRPLQRKCKVVQMWRQESSESTSCSTRVGRKLSSATLEHCSQGDSIASELSKHSRVDHHHEGNVAWPLVGLLVALLFLVMGRVPAIMATSLSFVVVSPHSRARGSRRGSSTLNPDHR